MNIVARETPAQGARQELESAAVWFAGDLRNSMQLTESQFKMASTLAGNKLAIFNDSPAAVCESPGIQNAH